MFLQSALFVFFRLVWFSLPIIVAKTKILLDDRSSEQKYHMVDTCNMQKKVKREKRGITGHRRVSLFKSQKTEKIGWVDTRQEQGRKKVIHWQFIFGDNNSFFFGWIHLFHEDDDIGGGGVTKMRNNRKRKEGEKIF